MTVELSSEMVRRLRREGSSLYIEMASPHNLYWTWRITYRDGVSGRETTRTGAYLDHTLYAVQKDSW